MSADEIARLSQNIDCYDCVLVDDPAVAWGLKDAGYLVLEDEWGTCYAYADHPLFANGVRSAQVSEKLPEKVTKFYLKRGLRLKYKKLVKTMCGKPGYIQCWCSECGHDGRQFVGFTAYLVPCKKENE